MSVWNFPKLRGIAVTFSISFRQASSATRSMGPTGKISAVSSANCRVIVRGKCFLTTPGMREASRRKIEGEAGSPCLTPLAILICTGWLGKECVRWAVCGAVNIESHVFREG